MIMWQMRMPARRSSTNLVGTMTGPPSSMALSFCNSSPKCKTITGCTTTMVTRQSKGLRQAPRPWWLLTLILTGGVAKSEASTDSPYSPLVLKTRDGRIVSDRNGNLFHYVIEPTLWGTKSYFVKRLGPAAAEKLKPLQVLPRADVLTASADECARKLDELLGWPRPGNRPWMNVWAR
jgi:hypothetical protein